jgi:hypothetical protein
VLEDAERGPLGLDGLAHLEPALGDRHQLARLDFSQEPCADDVERAAFGRDHVAILDLAEAEWADAGRVPKSDDGVRGHDHRRISAAQVAHHRRDRVLDALRGVGGDQRRDDLRVGGRAEARALLEQLVVERDRVDQVAVVGERDGTAVVPVHRLGVLPARATGGRVADVADRHLPGEGLEAPLVEDL